MKYLLYAVFTVLAGTMFYSFIRSAQDGERRHSCTAACALRPEYADYNRLAPDFELPTLDGGKFKLSEHRGKVVVVNFWTKTCGPCLQEMPELAEFGQILAAANDKILLVTVSTDESAQDARQTLMSVLQDAKSGVSPEEYKPPFVALVDSENDVVLGKYGTKLYPETWFIDPEGVIRARFDGPRDWSDALYLDLAESLLGRSSCRVSFPSKSQNGVPEQCKDLPVAG